MGLTLVTAMRSVTGPHRSNNQDSVGASEEYVFVADGVGGHAGGDVASWTVTHRLMSLLAPAGSRDLSTEELQGVLAQANAEIGQRARRDPALTGMSTTFTGLFCTDDAARVAHIGDSRAYLVRDGEGRRVTRDDSLVQMLVEQGAIGADEAYGHPRRNVILRSLAGSLEDGDNITMLEVATVPGDRWLLASDGLTDYVPEAEVLALLAEAAGPEEAADALVAAAEAADAGDNITVAVSDVVDAPASEAGAERPYR
ncbi:PP2C family serine/threonine-protein phosphatase [Actinotalea sp. C106]|uniref:PP2C family protein-serine/threonine phosphatase n=1 Tax=Actinotalea sp. C106 TaxID=2908644 RepID=UPI00202972BE|nr:protein phosphatase 2C domain-containing protein [Actinotalea sp. C106]